MNAKDPPRCILPVTAIYYGEDFSERRTRGLIRELIIMTILILGLLYAILMISVGVNEIYFYSTGKSNFLY